MQAFPASDLCHHQNHLPDRLHDDGCGADNRAWMMSSRQSPTTMYRSWVWCTECSSLDVCGTLWTNLLPRTKNKATIEVFAGQSNEESVWETTTYCPSTRLVSRSSIAREASASLFYWPSASNLQIAGVRHAFGSALDRPVFQMRGFMPCGRRPDGEIGRHCGLKIRRFLKRGVPVRPRLGAPLRFDHVKLQRSL